MKLIYFGKVDEAGNIRLPKRMRKEIESAFVGKPIQVEVKRKAKRRSNDQNAYYWGVIIPIVLQAFIDLGNELQHNNPEHAQIVHEFLKDKFLNNGLDLVDAKGQAHKTGASTRRLTTAQFDEYKNKIQQFGAEYLNVQIPDPNEQIEFILND